MKLLSKAIEVASALYDSQSTHRCQHFAFLAYKGRFVSIGRNSIKTHPINLRNPKFNEDKVNVSYEKGSCAELNALLKLKKLTNIKAEKCVLINLRVDNNNKIAYSRPCSSCISLLKYFNLKDIYYSNNQGEFEKLKI